MRRLALLGMVVGCGRLDFGPASGIAAACPDPFEPNDTPGDATPLAIGEPLSATLCAGDVDVYAVTLAGGDEIAATVAKQGPGWPKLTIIGDDGATTRAIGTIDDAGASVGGFADRDGTFYVVVAGLPTATGTPYTIDIERRTGPHYFVAPTGDDSGAGTFAQPWQHLDNALDKLASGDTLVLEDGRYNPATNGTAAADCSNGAANGTSASPIRVTALTERHAEIDSDAQAPAFYIANCSYWELEGLHLENTDVDIGDSGSGEGLGISFASNLTVRRMLLAHPNRYQNSHLIEVYTSTNVVVEESEIYDFHRHGISVGYGDSNIVRRNFANSRGYADIPGGLVTQPSDRGDSGFVLASTTNAISENNIELGNGAYTIDAESTSVANVRVLGNVVLGDGFGVLSSLEDTSTGDNLGTMIADHVAINSSADGFYLRSNEQATCVRCTSIGARLDGWSADQLSTQPRADASSSCTACLMTTNGNNGFDVQAQDGGWSIASSNAFGNATDFQPSGVPELTATSEIDPAFAGCLVYAPDGSPLRAAAPDGGDIGARVANRYQDGALTDLPLWDPQTGAFPCGLVIAGVNDDPATGCIGIAQQLHVGTPDCSLPFPAP